MEKEKERESYPGDGMGDKVLGLVAKFVEIDRPIFLALP